MPPQLLSSRTLWCHRVTKGTFVHSVLCGPPASDRCWPVPSESFLFPGSHSHLIEILPLSAAGDVGGV